MKVTIGAVNVELEAGAHLYVESAETAVMMEWKDLTPETQNALMLYNSQIEAASEALAMYGIGAAKVLEARGWGDLIVILEGFIKQRRNKNLFYINRVQHEEGVKWRTGWKHFIKLLLLCAVEWAAISLLPNYIVS